MDELSEWQPTGVVGFPNLLSYVLEVLTMLHSASVGLMSVALRLLMPYMALATKVSLKRPVYVSE